MMLAAIAQCMHSRKNEEDTVIEKQKNLILIMLIIMHANLGALQPTDEQLHMLEEILTSHGPRTFLLSFPRSGNTWLRYCLEFLTQRPSLGYYGLYYPTQRPLGWSAGFLIDYCKAPIIKVHRPGEMILRHAGNTRSPNPEIDNLILVLRNPKESFARRHHQSWQSLLLNAGAYDPSSYFANIDFFETWPEHMRLLIYYEDLITDPRTILTRILTFLHQPLTRLDQFMDNYEEYKKTCLMLYRGSISKGNDIFFHSKKTSREYHRTLDDWIATAYPSIWDTYLRERYATKP